MGTNYFEAKTTFEIPGLKQLVEDVDAGRGQIERGWREIAAIYRGFVLRRFRSYSRGGGDWPGLSEATLRAKGSSSILIDTGIMVGAMNPVFSGAPGQLESLHSDRLGVTVGFNTNQHGKGGSVTIADIASFHQLGSGKLPKREILVEPDDRTIQQMARAMELHIRRQGGDNSAMGAG